MRRRCVSASGYVRTGRADPGRVNFPTDSGQVMKAVFDPHEFS